MGSKTDLEAYFGYGVGCVWLALPRILIMKRHIDLHGSSWHWSYYASIFTYVVVLPTVRLGSRSFEKLKAPSPELRATIITFSLSFDLI
jgi:hypothetical protein|uniref:Uncharacterized protein n=1 Tax=Bionectria ochroleuca TaxID=29856 RepID=A0A8H7NEK0_BIOOC